jgi:hypothetical protein
MYIQKFQNLKEKKKKPGNLKPFWSQAFQIKDIIRPPPPFLAEDTEQS